MTEPKFKIGQIVRIIAASHGWDDVRKGNIGTILIIESSYSSYIDRIIYTYGIKTNRVNYIWIGNEDCFEFITNKSMLKKENK